MSKYTYNYKAGDFTSGKMGEIFKSVFMEPYTTVINHKQFGDCYIIPKNRMKDAVNFALSSFLGIELKDEGERIVLDLEGDIALLEQMKGSPYNDFVRAVIECNVEGVSDEHDWFSILNKVIDLTYLYDIGEDPDEYIKDIKSINHDK